MEKIFKLFAPSHFITDFNKICCESLQWYDPPLLWVLGRLTKIDPPYWRVKPKLFLNHCRRKEVTLAHAQFCYHFCLRPFLYFTYFSIAMGSFLWCLKSRRSSSFIFCFRQTPRNSNVWREKFWDMKINYLFYHIIRSCLSTLSYQILNSTDWIIYFEQFFSIFPL